MSWIVKSPPLLNHLEVIKAYHFTLSAQYAADILPLAMFLAWRALNDLRLAAYEADSPAFFGLPDTPCCPNLIVFTLLPSLATTM